MKTKDTVILALFVIAIILAFCGRMASANDLVFVDRMNERCANQFDDVNGMHESNVEGVKMALDVMTHQFNTYVSVCTYVMDLDTTYAILQGSKGPHVVINAYYEPDSLEVCQMVKAELARALGVDRELVESCSVYEAPETPGETAVMTTIYLPVVINQ